MGRMKDQANIQSSETEREQERKIKRFRSWAYPVAAIATVLTLSAGTMGYNRSLGKTPYDAVPVVDEYRNELKVLNNLERSKDELQRLEFLCQQLDHVPSVMQDACNDVSTTVSSLGTAIQLSRQNIEKFEQSPEVISYNNYVNSGSKYLGVALLAFTLAMGLATLDPPSTTYRKRSSNPAAVSQSS